MPSLLERGAARPPDALTHPDEVADPKVTAEGLSFSFGSHRVLKNLHMPIARNLVTALIGPSGCGKTTFLRCFNRMHDLYPDIRYEGRLVLHPDGRNIIAPEVHPVEMRMRIGMVFQKPNPYPKSIFDNVAFGLRLHGVPAGELKDRVEEALQRAALWKEVKDRLRDPAYGLSGGQQQRLCIARALATDPEVLLLDEPTSALDPVATAKVEELIHSLRGRTTVVIVTHNMQQAARVSDYTAFMYLGEIIEFGPTERIFLNPRQQMTNDYVTGRFG
ncbi:MAG: phosphate ABC transporter ATP-binding protein PstB [Candidatus Sumerlaeaceae bacterium]|nr:phosphate ABC transporter ATP-binding protein PstB [Candidatus Sumerlaeaceae bacterium]